MLNHSVRRWIPEKLNEREMVQQFADAVDWLLSVDYPNADKLALRFEAIKNKYKNLNSVPLEDIYAILEETGYNYITDALYLSEDSLRTFLAFLNFIHARKGSRRGLEFVLRLLEIDFKLSEWYEQIPMGNPQTYNMDLTILNPESLVGLDIVNKIVNFTRNYVYPLIDKLSIEFKLTRGNIYIGGAYKGHASITMYPPAIEVGDLWDLGNWDDLGWS